MDQRPEGWVVFYSERGGEFSSKVHREEASTCADLLDRLLDDEHVFFDLVVGPSPPEEADAAFDAWLTARGDRPRELAGKRLEVRRRALGSGAYWRRNFVKITAIRRLAPTH